MADNPWGGGRGGGVGRSRRYEAEAIGPQVRTFSRRHWVLPYSLLEKNRFEMKICR